MKIKLNTLDANIGKDIEGYYFLSDIKISSGKKGRYANVFLTDNTGNHTARMWEECLSDDGKKEAALIGKVVHIFGRVDAYDGKGSLIIGAIEEAAEGSYDMSDVARCLSKEQVENLGTYIYTAINQIADVNIRTLVKTIITNKYELFMQLPAGIKMHHNINGGLAIHTCEVYYLAKQYCTIARNMFPVKGYGVLPDTDLVIAGALLHDIGKLEEYKGFPSAKITRTGELLGHLELGVGLVRDTYNILCRSNADFFRDIARLDELCHIILASHGDESMIPPKTLEALIVSFADNYSAQCDNYGVLASEDKTNNPDDPGDFFYSKNKQRRFLRRK